MELVKVFAKKADDRRVELNLTQSELAERLNADHGAISKILSGKVRVQVDTLEKWAKALECDPGWLIARDDVIRAPEPSLDAKKLALISFILTLDKADFGTVETAVNAVSKSFKKNQASAISG